MIFYEKVLLLHRISIIKNVTKLIVTLSYSFVTTIRVENVSAALPTLLV